MGSGGKPTPMTEPKGKKITELEVFEAMLQRAEITYRKRWSHPMRSGS
jgi:hypothetical protein